MIQGKIMHLCITGFLSGDSDDTSLKYELNVPSQCEQAVLEVLGWQALQKARTANGC